MPSSTFVLVLFTTLMFVQGRCRRSLYDAVREGGADRQTQGHKSHPLIKASAVLVDQEKVSCKSKRSFPDLKVLGFVTPWNKEGVNVAMRNAARGRLDIVAPVTYQVLPNGLNGGHDFDDAFYSNLTGAGEPSFSMAVNVYPRFVFEKWSLASLRALVQTTEKLNDIVDVIAATATKRHCKGVVIEIWQTLLAVGAFRFDSDDVSGSKRRTFQLIRDLGRGIRDAGVTTVLVLPPYDIRTAEQSGLTGNDFASLKDSYQYIVAMTYDFSVPGNGKPGPIAPLPWCEAVLQFLAINSGLQSQVLLGLDFYGVDFEKGTSRGRHIVGLEYLRLLKEYESDVVWLDEFSEDTFTYKSDMDGTEHLVFYPTPRSIRARLNLAQRLGSGVAIWELGQGLPYLMDEL